MEFVNPIFSREIQLLEERQKQWKIEIKTMEEFIRFNYGRER